MWRKWLSSCGTSRTLAAAASFALVSTAQAAEPCRPETEPLSVFVTTEPDAGTCLAGSAQANDQDDIEWSLEPTQTGLFHISLEGLPGQRGAVLIASVDGGSAARELWRGDLRKPGETLSSPPLLLTEGRYRLVAGAAGGPLTYRLRVRRIATLPAALPTPEVSGEFNSLVRHAVGQDASLLWKLDSAVDGVLWSFSVQPVLGTRAYLSLSDAAGKQLLQSGAQDAASVVRLPDLALPPGQYRLTVGGLDPDAPAVVAARSDQRASPYAIEPDGDPPQAHELTLGQAVSGRLITNGVSEEHDNFVVRIPDGRTHLVEASASATTDARLTLAVVDRDGSIVQQRAGEGEAALRGLALAPGEHFFRVSGSMLPSSLYTLVLTDVGTPAESAEREPNDRPTVATALDAGGTLSGSFTGNEYDYVDLGVSGALELWDIEVAGEGLSGLTLYTGGDNVIASAGRSPETTVARLSRVLLPPGRTVLRLSGDGGSWLLRTRRLGAPSADEEIEPNENETQATALVPGRPHTGWLDHVGDSDAYAFHLGAQQHVVLELEGPAAETPIEVSANSGGDRIFRFTTVGAAGEPQRALWDGLLDAGDYVVYLAGAPARDPYRLSLALAPYFERPADLEPNGEFWQARPITGARLTGRLNGRETDVFRLPPQATPGALQVSAKQVPPGAIYVTVTRLTPQGDERVGAQFLYAAGESAAFDLPGGADIALALSGPGAGDYELALTAPGLSSAAAATPPVEARIEVAAEVAAFAARGQRVAGTLRVRNVGETALHLETRAWIGDETWSIAGLPPALDVPARGEAVAPFTVVVAPEADVAPVDVEIALLKAGARPAIARARIESSIDAAVVGAAGFETLPPKLLGGVDVAWSALGGSTQPEAAALIDGVIEGAGVKVAVTSPPVFDLAGDAPAPIAGVILHPPAGLTPAQRLAEFAIEVSTDGASFTRVLTAHLSPQAREQAFELSTPVTARFVRLVPLASHGGPQSEARLAEFKVVAVPDFELGGDGFDVASAALGGHIVRTAGFDSLPLTGDGAAWPAARPPQLVPKTATPEWVLGFLSGRAAQIARVVWHQPSDSLDSRIRDVEVAASIAGAFGPWASLGRWRVDTGASAPAVLTPERPIWARALRFRVVDAPPGSVLLPQRIEVIEHARGPSLVGEWGDGDARGPYEISVPQPAEPAEFPAVSHSESAATPLALGAQARGRVQRGRSEDWYELDLPAETRALRVRFEQGLAPEVALTVFDSDGRATELEPNTREPGELVAPARPGRVKLRVTQPQQSVAVSWDTSISVGPYVPHVVRLVQRIVWQLQPEHEQINLLPFGSEGPLLASWSGDPGAVYGALHAYPWRDTSSDADGTLSKALSKLETRVGARAVVLVTDAADGIELAEPVWKALERTRTKVFALHLPVDSDAPRVRQQMNLLVDWSQANGGFYKRFASQGDAESVFRRINAWLRKPATYAFVASADTAPPAPGKLTVRREQAPAGGGAAAPSAAVEIVLDASGSMLQRLGNVRRIEIARQALGALAANGVPANTNVALRVFGQGGAGSCASDVVLPLAPLDARAFTAAVGAVKPVDGAKTPIGESLRLAGADLAGVAEPKLIVLVTDGEETCDGDPEAEIAKLRAAGLDVRVNIVGFAIDDAGLKETFARWAAAGGGGFFDAGDARALDEALERAIATRFELRAADGSVIAGGAVGDESLEVAAGEYSLSVGGAAPVGIRIASGTITTVELDASGAVIGIDGRGPAGDQR